MCPLFGETFESDGIRRTYREPVTPDRPTGQSAVKAAADQWFEWNKRQDEQYEADEKARLDKQRQREAAEQDAARRREVAQRQREFLAADALERELEEDLSGRMQ
jgi:hypothetical protein